MDIYLRWIKRWNEETGLAKAKAEETEENILSIVKAAVEHAQGDEDSEEWIEFEGYLVKVKGVTVTVYSLKEEREYAVF